MSKEILPSAQRARELVAYDPQTGIFTWKKRGPVNVGSVKSWNTRYANTEAFTSINAHGYKSGRLDSCSVVAHRVAWAVHYGEWPEKHIDHIDGDKLNNKIENLRLATNQENMFNKGARADNKCGYKGVHWNKMNKKWKAQISKDGKIYYLGLFLTAEEAYAAYCDAAKRMHGEFHRVS